MLYCIILQPSVLQQPWRRLLLLKISLDMYCELLRILLVDMVDLVMLKT